MRGHGEGAAWRTASAAAKCPSISSPAATPSMSAAGRFWLHFALVSARVMESSSPTIADLTRDVVGRRVVNRPRLRPDRLVMLGQAAHKGLDPGRVIVNYKLPVYVRDEVVPSGHHFAVLGLGRVERRRHVGIWAMHDDERLAKRGVRHCGFARATCPRRAPAWPTTGSYRSGRKVARSPSAVTVTRSAAAMPSRNARSAASPARK